tara:strand:- start:1533 stop:3035 length:1503 start_codon:yes stop_codon:yes gene_type:complete
MPYLPPKDRIEPTIDLVEDFLYEMGPVDKEDGVTVDGIRFEIAKVERTGGSPMRLELHFEHPGAMRYINKLKSTIWKELKQYFTMPYPDVMYKGYKALPFGYKSAGTYTILGFEVEFTGEAPKGAVPAPIQEEGTTIVLNRALQNNIVFNSPESILDDPETKKKLTKLFGKKYEIRLKDWVWTYYQQNSVWLKEYGRSQWDPFVYGDRAFVKFFENHMKNLRRDFNPSMPAGNYTTWNPSDIWAVKNMSKVKQQIDAALKPKPQHLAELNNLLINLMEKEELIGISLKMVKKGADAHIKLHNVETSSVLTELDSFSKIEEYGMNDISFRYNNIWEGDTSYVPTQVLIGSGGKYEINIRKSGNNISFNTQIKGAAAQGGQTPVDMVVKMLKGREFKKNHSDYPQTPERLVQESDRFEKMYLVVTKGHNAPTWNQFQLHWEKVYKKSKKTAIVKLMQLAFWHDALTNYSKNTTASAEFWTDLLYTGMKIKPGREFAPHAKIS